MLELARAAADEISHVDSDGDVRLVVGDARPMCPVEPASADLTKGIRSALGGSASIVLVLPSLYIHDGS